MHADLDEQESIENWYQSYSHQIFRYIYVMVGDRQQARDLMQETFIKAFLFKNDFRGDASPKTWLYQIARNVTIDYQRKSKPITYYLDSFITIKSKSPLPAELLELEEDIEILYKCLFRLKQNYRQVIMLRKVKEFSTKESANILNWKESRVKTVLHRAMLELKKQMIREGYEYE